MAEANHDQIAFWNAEPAQKWALFRVKLDRLFGQVAQRLFDLSAPARGEAALDIGCGAGSTTLAAGDLVGPDGRVLGLDVSTDLLALAESRRLEAGAAQVAFELGDAQTHRLEPESFDVAISRFGVMFFDQPATAFANIARALRPGGRICFAAWDRREANPWFDAPYAAVADALGPAEPAAPAAPGPMAFADAPRTVRLFEAAGYARVGVRTEMVSLFLDGRAADAAALAVTVGPAMRRLREQGADEATAEKVAADVAHAFGAYEQPGSPPPLVEIPARIHFFQAVRAA